MSAGGYVLVPVETRGVRSLRAGVVGGCEPPDVSTRNWH